MAKKLTKKNDIKFLLYQAIGEIEEYVENCWYADDVDYIEERTNKIIDLIDKL